MISDVSSLSMRPEWKVLSSPSPMSYYWTQVRAAAIYELCRPSSIEYREDDDDGNLSCQLNCKTVSSPEVCFASSTSTASVLCVK